MRKALAISFVLSLFGLPFISHAAPRPAASPFLSLQEQQDQQYQDQNYQDDQGYQEYVPYSPEQLDNLLAPIALYPDPLLAQVLPAATFTDQIDDAARYVRAYGEDGVDEQPWDISVRSVAHYPEVLYMMDEKMDWTTALGQAYVNQSTDVMESVQRLRRMAYDQGNLVSNPDWQIVYNGGFVQIWPASPEYIYVPTYEPAIIYYRPCYEGDRFLFGFTFGRGFRIGLWLDRDTDWREHRIYYTGWRGDEDWERRSRPYVQVNNTVVRNVYINNTVNVTNITVNKTIVNRTVNVTNINNYHAVHQNVTFNNVVRNNNAAASRNPAVNNRVINQNINTSDPRLNQFRGHTNAPLPGQPREQSPAQNFRPTPQNQAHPEMQPRPEMQQQPRPTTPQRQFPPEQRPSQQVRPQEQPRPQFQPQPRSQPQYRPAPPPQGPHAFGRSETTFNPRVEQQRGAQSRQEMSRPPAPRAAPPRPAPRQERPAPSRPHHPGGER